MPLRLPNFFRCCLSFRQYFFQPNLIGIFFLWDIFMKTKLLLGLAMLSSTSAFAMIDQEGVIHLSGYIYSSTCELDINNQGPVDAAVNMGRYPTSSFSKIGDEVGGNGGFGEINMTLKNCPETGELAVSFNGSTIAGNNEILALDNSAINDTAKGLGVHVYSAKDLAKPLNLDGSQVLKTMVDNSAEFQESFIARYVSTAEKVGSGEANATLNFKVTYK